MNTSNFCRITHREQNQSLYQIELNQVTFSQMHRQVQSFMTIVIGWKCCIPLVKCPFECSVWTGIWGSVTITPCKDFYSRSCVAIIINPFSTFSIVLTCCAASHIGLPEKQIDMKIRIRFGKASSNKEYCDKEKQNRYLNINNFYPTKGFQSQHNLYNIILQKKIPVFYNYSRIIVHSVCTEQNYVYILCTLFWSFSL